MGWHMTCVIKCRCRFSHAYKRVELASNPGRGNWNCYMTAKILWSIHAQQSSRVSDVEMNQICSRPSSRTMECLVTARQFLGSDHPPFHISCPGQDLYCYSLHKLIRTIELLYQSFLLALGGRYRVLQKSDSIKPEFWNSNDRALLDILLCMAGARLLF